MTSDEFEVLSTTLMNEAEPHEKREAVRQSFDYLARAYINMLMGAACGNDAISEAATTALANIVREINTFLER